MEDESNVEEELVVTGLTGVALIAVLAAVFVLLFCCRQTNGTRKRNVFIKMTDIAEVDPEDAY